MNFHDSKHRQHGKPLYTHHETHWGIWLAVVMGIVFAALLFFGASA